MRPKLLIPLIAALVIATLAMTGCKKDTATTNSVEATKDTPVIKIVWSFYTAWSLLAAAHDFGDFDDREGYLGELEKKFGVDLVLTREEYVQSMTDFQAGNYDGIVLTNTDALATAFGRKKQVGDATVALFPTSWSDGADQIDTDADIKTWADLKGIPVKGAEFSVTHYLFWRACQINSCTYSEYTFENLQPDKGAPLFAARQDGFRAFGGWSPETFVVLNARKDVNVLFDSSRLDKYEITDMFVMGQKALDKPGGAAAAKVLAEALNRMSDRLGDSATRMAALKATSKRFNNETAETIDRALELTKILPPKTKANVLTSDEMRKNMPHVDEFSIVHNLTEGTHVSYGWGKKDEVKADLRFDLSYLE